MKSFFIMLAIIFVIVILVVIVYVVTTGEDNYASTYFLQGDPYSYIELYNNGKFVAHDAEKNFDWGGEYWTKGGTIHFVFPIGFDYSLPIENGVIGRGERIWVK